MLERVGILKMLRSWRWAICRPGNDPVEITAGDLFRVELEEGVLRVRRRSIPAGHEGRADLD